MSLKKNVVANYVGQAYTTLVGVVMLPLYLEFLGAEAYGLVGFFTLLFSWLSLLTAGISPALFRQVAHYRGRAELGGEEFRTILRSVEFIFLGLALVIALVVWLASPWLASHWLTVKAIPLSDVAYCIALMGAMVGLRWGAALYVGCLGGMERQVWLNGYGIVFSTIRFVIVYAFLRWVTRDPVHYFQFQLVVSVLELAVVAHKFYGSLPAEGRQADPGLKFSWPALRELLPFATGITYTSMLWVFMTQSDKLILSHVLTLAEYGFFALVVAIANGVLKFSSPISNAALPRLTLLLSQGREQDMVVLYRKTTQYVVVVVASVAGILAMFSQQILFALTGSQDAASWGGAILTWFALGNGILTIVGMQYLLQYVHGKVRMHVINTTINAAVQVPILAYVALNYGALEVAITWFAIRFTTFFIWPAVVHHKFVPGLHWKWLGRDVLLPMMGAAMGLGLAHWLVAEVPELMIGRLQIALTIGVAVLLVLFTSALVASDVRGAMVRMLKNLRQA